jgi:hypothetical protein
VETPSRVVYERGGIVYNESAADDTSKDRWADGSVDRGARLPHRDRTCGALVKRAVRAGA